MGKSIPLIYGKMHCMAAGILVTVDEVDDRKKSRGWSILLFISKIWLTNAKSDATFHIRGSAQIGMFRTNFGAISSCSHTGFFHPIPGDFCQADAQPEERR